MMGLFKQQCSMGKIINPKGSGSLLNVKGSGSVFNVKPVVGSMLRHTADDAIVRISQGQIIGPGFFFFLTYPEQIDMFP